MRVHGLCFGQRRCHAHARPKPRVHAHAGKAVRVLPVCVHHQRHVKHFRLLHRGKCKLGRHDPDNGDGLPRDVNDGAHRTGISVQDISPESVISHGNRRVCVGFRQHATHATGRAGHREKAGAHSVFAHHARSIPGCDRRGQAFIGFNRRKGSHPGTHGQKIFVGETFLMPPDHAPDGDKPIRMRQGHGPDQHGVDDGEHRGHRAQAEREREHGGEREHGCIAKLAQGVAEILPECLHLFLP